MDDTTTTPTEPLVLEARAPFVVQKQVVRTFSNERLFASAAAIVLVAAVVYGGVRQWGDLNQADTVAYVVPILLEEEEAPSGPTGENPYAALTLEARAALVYDVYEDRFLYVKEGEKALPLASLTKLMTSLLAIESIDPNANVAISQNAIDTEGDSGFFANERWRLRDLVSFTMLTSSNDGADALAAAVGGLFQTTPATTSEYEKVDSFVGKMNQRADELGLGGMRFTNATGLDEPNGDLGGVGTAKDVARLFAYIWEHSPEAFAYTDREVRTFTSTDGYTHIAENTNEYVYSTPGIIGSKTGYTDKAGGNLAVLYNSGLDHPLVVVVLGSSKDGRFTDVEKLVDATSRYVETGWYAFEVAGSTARE